MLLPTFITWHANKSDLTATDKKKPKKQLCLQRLSFAPLKMRMAERLGDNFLPHAWCSQKPWFLEELLWWVCITVVKRITERWLQKGLGWVLERKYKQRIIKKIIIVKLKRLDLPRHPPPTNFHGNNGHFWETNNTKLARQPQKHLWLGDYFHAWWMFKTNLYN